MEPTHNEQEGGNDGDQGITFTIGTVVEVMARCWVGSNKPGGVGRVIGVHFNEGNSFLLHHYYLSDLETEDDSTLYDVAYIVNNGKEYSIEERYVRLHEVETGRRRTQGRCK